MDLKDVGSNKIRYKITINPPEGLPCGETKCQSITNTLTRFIIGSNHDWSCFQILLAGYARAGLILAVQGARRVRSQALQTVGSAEYLRYPERDRAQGE